MTQLLHPVDSKAPIIIFFSQTKFRLVSNQKNMMIENIFEDVKILVGNVFSIGCYRGRNMARF